MAATSAFHYQRLSPDLILDMIESIGVFPETGLTPLNSYENRVYQFRCSHGNKYVAKFYRPERWSIKQIQEEHEFALELAAQEIPIAAPIFFNGKSVHEYDGFKFALFPSIGGRAFENDNLNQLEAVGHFIGRIHQYAQNTLFKERDNYAPTTIGETAITSLENCPLIPTKIQPKLIDCANALIEQTQQLWMQHNPSLMRVHGDLHSGNILWTPDGPSFVDLDDAINGPAIQDLWMMLSGDKNQQLLQLDILLEAYETFTHFDTQELNLIEPLRAMRILHYNGWLAKRWDDPAFPRHFPWFDSAEYWETQLVTFMEQQKKLTEPALNLIPY